jgi:hypothetical protein
LSRMAGNNSLPGDHFAIPADHTVPAIRLSQLMTHATQCSDSRERHASGEPPAAPPGAGAASALLPHADEPSAFPSSNDEARRPAGVTIEALLGSEAKSSGPVRRTWWRVVRNGTTRYLIPTHRKRIPAALQLENHRLYYWKLWAQLWMPRLAGGPEVIGSSRHTPLDEFLDSVFPGERLEYAVHCGTNSVYEKYTIQCQDADGRARAYVKVSRGSRAKESMLNEVAVLRRLQANPAIRSRIPEVLELAERWGCCVSVLSSPRSVNGLAPRYPEGGIVQFMTGLFACDAFVSTWTESPVRKRILASAVRLEQTCEKLAAGLLNQALAVLDADFGDTPLPHGRAHGDFLPWNVRMTPDPFVFDWEWSRVALPFHDLYHYLAFPLIGSRWNRSARDIDAQNRAPRARRLLASACVGALPYGSADARWWRAYVSDAFAFYAESACAGSQHLGDHALIDKLGALLKLALEAKR